jgi:hypothetical protein
VRRQTAALIVAAGTLGTVALGGGLTAWASWSVDLTNGRGALKAAALPTMDEPEAEATSRIPRVEWAAMTFASGHPVGGYVVIRRTGDVRAEACRVPASTLSCADAEAKPGSTVTYTVQAVAGTRWTGPESPASDSVHVPGKPARTESVKEKSPSTVGSTSTADTQTNGGGQDDDNVSGPTEQAEATAPAPSVSPSASASPSPSVTDGGEGGGAG